MLHREGELLTDKLEYQITHMCLFLEPALILLVAVILISMYLPMFRLGGIIG